MRWNLNNIAGKMKIIITMTITITTTTATTTEAPILQSVLGRFSLADDIHFHRFDLLIRLKTVFSSVPKGCDTRITINGPGMNIHFGHTFGNQMDAFQTHKDVTVYGAIPSNIFNPANVKIKNFMFNAE